MDNMEGYTAAGSPGGNDNAPFDTTTQVLCMHCREITESIGFSLHVHYVHGLRYSAQCACPECQSAREHQAPLGQGQISETVSTPNGDDYAASDNDHLHEQASSDRRNSIASNDTIGDQDTTFDTTSGGPSQPSIIAPVDVVAPTTNNGNNSVHHMPYTLRPVADNAVFDGYRVAPAGKNGDRTALLPDDADFWEDKLPWPMGQIESGDLVRHGRKITWQNTGLKEPSRLFDQNSGSITSASTGRFMHNLPFLPVSISTEVEAWRIELFIAKAIADGVDMELFALCDRMNITIKRPAPTPKSGRRTGNAVDHAVALKKNALSTKSQRWRAAIGMLPQSTRRNFGLPSQQSISTISKLTFIQAELNTWWLPNHTGRQGPWTLYQPQYHPGYQVTPHVTHGEPANYHILNMAEPYGLSEEVDFIFDGMLFMQAKAEEVKQKIEDLSAWLCATSTTDNDRQLFSGEFECWRQGSKYTPSIGELRMALEAAQNQADFDAIHAGDFGSSIRLQWIQAHLDVEEAQS